MSWSDIENAMQMAVSQASGYPSDHVYWSYQQIKQPDDDFIVIKFGGEIVIGIDRIETSQDLNRPNGQEIKQEIQGVREVPFELQCFTPSAVVGEAAARRVLEVTRTKLRLDSIRFGMTKAGVTPFDLGTVQYVPDIPSTKFRGRAICTLRCYVPVMDCIEYVGYIAHVSGIVTVHGLVQGSSGYSFQGDVSSITANPAPSTGGVSLLSLEVTP